MIQSKALISPYSPRFTRLSTPPGVNLFRHSPGAGLYALEFQRY